MTRRLNRRLLVRSVVAVVAAATLVHALHAYQVQRHAAALVRQALQAEAEGDLSRSAHYLDTYLAHVPGDTDALERYGRVLARAARSPQDHYRALQVLEQVLRRDATRKSAREAAAEQALKIELYGDLARHLEELRKTAADPADVSEGLAWAYVGARDYARAAEAFADAIRAAPRRLDNYAQLADLYTNRLDAPDRAAQVMDELVAANPRSAPAYLARARWREGRGLTDDAAADLARAEELAPADVGVHLAAAEFARRRDRPAEAREQLRRGFAVRPNDPRLHEAAGNLALQEGRRGEALDHFRRGLWSAPDDAPLLVQLADALLDDGAAADVAALRDRLGKLADPGPGADYLDARLRAQRGEWVAAARALEALQEAAADQPWADRRELALARCYEQTGDAEQRLRACVRAVRLNPGSLPARLELVRALLAAGHADEAAREGRALTARPGAPAEAWLELGRALVEANRRLPPAERGWAEAERACRTAARAMRGTAPVLLLADLLAAQGRSAQAREVLAEASESAPDAPELWAARAALAAEDGNYDEAARLLAQARTRLGDRAKLRAAAARIAGRRAAAADADPADVRRELSALGRDLDKLPPAGRAEVLDALAAAWLQAGAPEAAVRAARRRTAVRPDDLAGWLTLFDLAGLAGDAAAARQAVDGLRRVEGEDGVRWRCAEAWLALQQAREGDSTALAAARARLDEAARLQPGWGRVWLLRADLAEREGRSDRALDHYLRAFEQGDRSPPGVARLVQLLQDRGRFAEADRVLRRLEREGPLAPALTRAAAEAARRLRNFPRAVELAHRAVPPESRDHRDHVWLARLLADAGQPSDAEAVLRRAAARFADAPGPWVALVELLARAGRPADARAALREAEDRLGPNAHLALARCSEALGRVTEAETRYQAAADAAPYRPSALQALASFYLRHDQPAQAVPLLRRLLAADLEAPAGVAGWARRELALATAAPGTEAAVREALALLGSGGSVADERARALVLGSRPAHRREALRRFEETLGQQPLTPDEQFRLAQLYEADNDRPRARELFFSLLADHDHEPQYLAGFVRLLLARGDVDEARRWLARLERIEPDSLRTRTLKADLARKAAESAAS